MKYAKIFCTVVLLFLAIASVSCALASEDSIVRYELTPEKIMAARVLIISSEKFPDHPKYSVIAELNFQEMDVFGKLTKENIGRRLEVSFQGTVLFGAIVKGEIPNGIMTILKTNDKEEALSLVRELLP